jgi:hypothetical protein
MKEEMEEGHFDADGHYHFNKDAKGDLKDNWLDNIDWVKVGVRCNNCKPSIYISCYVKFTGENS